MIPSTRVECSRSQCAFSLQGADGSRIATYGVRSYTLNIGLRRNFRWVFVIWPLYGIARRPFFRGSVTVEVYVSSIRTRAFGRYIANGCCTGVAVKKGSTVLDF